VIDRLAGSRWPDRANQTFSQRLLDYQTGVHGFSLLPIDESVHDVWLPFDAAAGSGVEPFRM
jgi:hypothetical protein